MINSDTEFQLMALFLLVLIFSSVGMAYTVQTQHTDQQGKQTNRHTLNIHFFCLPLSCPAFFIETIG